MNTPGTDFKERRETPRLTRDFPGQWQKRPAIVQAAGAQAWHTTLVRNISRGGLCFQTYENLTASDMLNLRVEVDLSVPLMKCRGVVVRTRTLEQPLSTEIGVAFTEIDEKDADLIDVMAWTQTEA